MSTIGTCRNKVQKCIPNTSRLYRGVPEDNSEVRRGWVWEGVSPSHMLEKKSRC